MAVSFYDHFTSLDEWTQVDTGAGSISVLGSEAHINYGATAASVDDLGFYKDDFTLAVGDIVQIGMRGGWSDSCIHHVLCLNKVGGLDNATEVGIRLSSDGTNLQVEGIDNDAGAGVFGTAKTLAETVKHDAYFEVKLEVQGDGTLNLYVTAPADSWDNELIGTSTTDGFDASGVTVSIQDILHADIPQLSILNFFHHNEGLDFEAMTVTSLASDNFADLTAWTETETDGTVVITAGPVGGQSNVADFSGHTSAAWAELTIKQVTPITGAAGQSFTGIFRFENSGNVLAMILQTHNTVGWTAAEDNAVIYRDGSVMRAYENLNGLSSLSAGGVDTWFPGRFRIDASGNVEIFIRGQYLNTTNIGSFIGQSLRFQFDQNSGNTAHVFFDDFSVFIEEDVTPSSGSSDIAYSGSSSFFIRQLRNKRRFKNG